MNGQITLTNVEKWRVMEGNKFGAVFSIRRRIPEVSFREAFSAVKAYADDFERQKCSEVAVDAFLEEFEKELPGSGA